MSKDVFVYESWSSEKAALLGIIHIDDNKRGESFSFEYNDTWLKGKGGCVILDPDLQLYRGRQYAPLGKQLFGMFADSCPDRWGRMLLQRKEAIRARKEKRRPRKLQDSDYLLGVYDAARMGALRFSLSEGGTFQAADKELATPPWVSLRSLEAASFAFEGDEGGLEEKWLKQLLAPGSSLGGARPKATVQAVDGALWIAKFPSRHDEFNSGAWEKTAHDLALLCGLDVPEARLEDFSANGSTFLTKRFDREGAQRIHFASAMTLLGRTDGEEGVSYLDIADFIRSHGAEPEKDLRELWRRIVFSMAVSNTDDHLRNHGFILQEKGWRLSPMYDVNPVPYGDALSLMVSLEDAAIDTDLAIETASYYGLEKEEAGAMADEMLGIIGGNWERIAKANGLGRSAVEYMRPAFGECMR